VFHSNELIATLNEEQALERIGGKHGHKGEEAAYTALSMAKFRYIEGLSDEDLRENIDQE
jgi:hypothetical protein